MKGWIVSKFGGSSVKDAAAMLRCAEIIRSNPEIRIVILSATYNTTNKLEQIRQLAVAGREKEALSILGTLKDFHIEMALELGCDEDTMAFVDELIAEGDILLRGISLLRECSVKTMDALYSIGERISSALFTSVLRKSFEHNVHMIDAREVIATDSNFGSAKPRADIINEKCQQFIVPFLEQGEGIIVTQGFIGANENGETTTLGREGSDYSAALIAAGVKSDQLQIWTDVPGVATIDPKRVNKACIIPEMTYAEAQAMARLGAKILFPETMTPVMSEDIPLWVGSSLAPEQPGTWVQSISDSPVSLRAIAVLTKRAILTVNDSCSAELLQHLSSYDFVSSNGHSTTVILQQDNPVLTKFDRSMFEKDYSLISLVGRELNNQTQLISNFFKFAFVRTCRMIQIGVDSTSISFLVPSSESADFVNNLHDFLLHHAQEHRENLNSLQ